MPTPTVINKYRFNDVINRRQWDTSYYFNPCNSNTIGTLLGGGAVAGAGAEVDVISSPGFNLEQFVIVGNTNLVPQLDSTGYGLNFAADTTSTHGLQFDTGITAANPFQFKIDTTGATQPAFFMKANWKVATAAGPTSLVIGFRKLEARNATFTSYTEFATIGTFLGEFETKTKNTLGSTTTDLLSASVNATTFTIEIDVDAFGNVTYKVNGVTPAAAVPFQFDNGTILIPFIGTVQSASTTTMLSNYIEWGLQS